MQWEQELTRQPKRELSYVCVVCHEGVTVCHDFALGGRSSSARHAHRHNRGAAAQVSKVVLCASRWFSGHIVHPLASLSMIVKWSPFLCLPLHSICTVA